MGGVGKASLLMTLEDENKKFPKMSKYEAEGKTTIKFGKNNKKTMDIHFFKLQPQISMHGNGWECKTLIERLKDTKAETKIHGVIYCIPARTYQARCDSLCSPGSIEKWI